MTTKVTITCQEDSHWDLKVITQDLSVGDNGGKEWANGAERVLGPGQTANDLYVWDTRRFVIEEVSRT